MRWVMALGRITCASCGGIIEIGEPYALVSSGDYVWCSADVKRVMGHLPPAQIDADSEGGTGMAMPRQFVLRAAKAIRDGKLAQLGKDGE